MLTGMGGPQNDATTAFLESCGNVHVSPNRTRFSPANQSSVWGGSITVSDSRFLSNTILLPVSLLQLIGHMNSDL